MPIHANRTRLIGSAPGHHYPVGYFDGAAQLGLGGAGLVIFISETHYLTFSVGVGLGTNTRAELLALWSVLKVSNMMGVPLNQIFGDSMVIISWENKHSALEIPALKHWCDDIIHMLLCAPPLTINHTFREHNTLADGLSKSALKHEIGTWYFSEIMDGQVINDGQFQLF